MAIQKITEVPVGSTPTSSSNVLVTQPEGGTESLRRIPLDKMSEAMGVTQLKADFILQMDEIPDTVQSYAFADGAVSKIVHNRSGVAIRTDTFVYGENTITEVRASSTGTLTIVTNLTTLETTVTYAAA